ncbi:TPA: superinfection exclusion B family protein, partial [Escherichia coli]|nr:superinfection exclusion B family protein [Escherichia coli]
MDVITGVAEFFRKVPAAFLVAITCVLGLILFLPDSLAVKVAVDGFRNEYRIFIGPAFLLSVSYLVARVYLSFYDLLGERQAKKVRTSYLEKLTAEEKGYLKSYI